MVAGGEGSDLLDAQFSVADGKILWSKSKAIKELSILHQQQRRPPDFYFGLEPIVAAFPTSRS
ncbi:hypothetical protein O9929_17615 [Vibrio lentus]|nr:hypothetical protein [Vibrio lentus]